MDDQRKPRMCPICKHEHLISFEDSIRRRGWERLDWECPHCILVEEFPLVMTPNGPAIANVGRDSEQSVIERHEAAILAYGIMNQSADRLPVNIALGPKKLLDVEVEDSVLRYKDGMVLTYPVQQKRVTRDDIDLHDEVNERIRSLADYTVKDLIGLVTIERSGTLQFDRIVIPEMKIMEVWISHSEDGIMWGLHAYGVAEKKWKHIRFMYPSVHPKENTVKHEWGDPVAR